MVMGGSQAGEAMRVEHGLDSMDGQLWRTLAAFFTFIHHHTLISRQITSLVLVNVSSNSDTSNTALVNYLSNDVDVSYASSVTQCFSLATGYRHGHGHFSQI